MLVLENVEGFLGSDAHALLARLAEALRVERKRVPTRPSRAAKEQRLDAKKRRGATKRLRRVDDGE